MSFNAAITHRPAYVVVVTSADDIKEVVNICREHSLAVHIQSTGHGAHSGIESGVLISTGKLQHVTIDHENQLATIGAGVRWDKVIAAAAPYDLVPVAGSSDNVGVVGYLLGGGFGPLVRSHGVSSDYIQSITVVTGKGELLTTSADAHPDLFWALRGGKSGLGVVVELAFKLVKLKTLYAGSMMYAKEDCEKVLRFWVDWIKDADPAVSTSVSLVQFPDFEKIPEAFRGKSVLSFRFAFPGDAEKGKTLVQPFRDIARPLIDDVKEINGAEMARIHNDPKDPTPTWMSGLMLEYIDQEFISIYLEQFGPGKKTPFMFGDLRHLGGKVKEDVKEGSAVSGRNAAFIVSFAGINPAQFEKELPEATALLNKKMSKWKANEMNINFIGKTGSKAQYESLWPAEIREKLNLVRKKYDPGELFAKK
jgi:hypothetical protein